MRRANSCGISSVGTLAGLSADLLSSREGLLVGMGIVVPRKLKYTYI